MFPLISEYIEAIKSAEDNFNELSYLKPVLDEDGLPEMTSGNFAVIFKMKDERDGKFYALKCFTKEQEGRAEAYKQITEELKNVESSYLVSIHYFDKELYVDTKQTTETEFPVLLMDWVEGKTLDKYLRENLDDKFALEMLAYRFSQLAQWLIPQSFAHGDLKPDNILVRKDGSLVLVDYDGMYVPAMKGQMARELGSPDFRHPQRTNDDFDEHIDDFPFISILLSIKAIAYRAELLDRYGANDRLLFSERDYRDISNCEILKELFPSVIAKINILISLFSLTLFNKTLTPFPVNFLNVEKPTNENDLGVDDWLDNNVTDLVDDNGVHYSKDKKTLIGAVDDWLFCEEYIIPEGIVEIKGGAFIRLTKHWFEPDYLKRIIIPSTVKIIGASAIAGIYEVICNSPNFKWYKKGLYTSDFKELLYYPFIKKPHKIHLHPKTEKISFYYFDKLSENSDYRWVIFDYYPYCVIYLSNPNIKLDLQENTFLCVPKGTVQKFVGNGYELCKIIEDDVFIDDYGSFYSGDLKTLVSFPYSSQETEYKVLDKCERICDNAFKKVMGGIDSEDQDYYEEKGNQLKTIILPEGIKEIGKNAFDGCKKLEKILIPSRSKSKFKKLLSEYEDILIEQNDTENLSTKVTNKDFSYAWTDKYGVRYSVDRKRLILGINTIENYSVRKGTVTICENAFCDCTKLHSIQIPDSITSIGNDAFRGCSGLTTITIPDRVKSIGKRVFNGCSGLTSIEIPDSVTSIGFGAFYGCNRLTSISIPNSVTSIGESAFTGCSSLTSISIPDSVTSIGMFAFMGCSGLTSIIIPYSVTKIGHRAFDYCNRLASIIIPKGEMTRFKEMLYRYKSIIRTM